MHTTCVLFLPIQIESQFEKDFLMGYKDLSIEIVNEYGFVGSLKYLVETAFTIYEVGQTNDLV